MSTLIDANRGFSSIHSVYRAIDVNTVVEDDVTVYANRMTLCRMYSDSMVGGNAVGSRCAWVLLVCLALGGCAPGLDTHQEVGIRGTFGEELYRHACGRLGREQFPGDVSGQITRAQCALNATPSGPEGPMRALVERRAQTVDALNRVVPPSLEPDLQSFSVALMPLYDLPVERLPRLTRSLSGFAQQAADDPAVLAALGRISARQGLRTPGVRYGLVERVLTYEHLSALATVGLEAVAEGGEAHDELLELEAALAFELGTLAPETTDEESTLDVVREWLLTRHPTFDGGGAGRLALRDRRGLPIPNDLASDGFVDGDGDGLADVNAEGRYLDPTGAERLPPTPFPTATGALFDVAARDGDGSALGLAGTPLYATFRPDGTLLAALVTEAGPLFVGNPPPVADLARAVEALLGPDVMRVREYGAATHTYPSFDTSESAALDLLHGASVLLARDELREVLTVASALLPDQEGVVADLSQSAFQALDTADEFPELALPADSDLWDDVVAALRLAATRPGLLEGLLRALTEPETERLGQMLAEMARHRDTFSLDASLDGGRGTPPLRNQYWVDEVARDLPDDGDNQSILQRLLAILHELDGAQLCNRDGAHMVMNVPILGRVDLMDHPGLAALGLQLEPFERCELVRIDNTLDAYALAMQGKLDLSPQLNAALPTHVQLLAAIATVLQVPAFTLDGLLEDNSGIEGFTTRPTAEALNRLLYSEWNEFLSELLERPTTVDGADVAQRHGTRVVLNLEREFRFCGDELLDVGQNCTSTVERMTLYEGLAPLIDAITTYDPAAQRGGGPSVLGALAGAFARHYPTARNTMFQEVDPTGLGFAHADGAVRYEPILSRVLGSCGWVDSGAGRWCDRARGADLLGSTSRLLRAVDAVDVDGRAGLDVVAGAARVMLDPAEHPGLTDRRGRPTTRTNSGATEVAYSPLYLLLDALNGVDDAWESDPEAAVAWRRARSALADQFLAAETASGQPRFQNRRTPTLFRAVVDLLAARIDHHRATGEILRWSSGLTPRAERSLGGPLVAAAFRLVDAMDTLPRVRDELFAFLHYLTARGEAFDATLLAVADLVQLLADEENGVPLGRFVGGLFASNLDAALRDGDTLGTGLVAEGVSTLKAVSELDDREILPQLLTALAVPYDELDPRTPLDVLFDVVLEVNRVEPGQGGTYREADHGALLRSIIAFLADEQRGLERLYDVIQGRGVSQ